MCRNFSSNRARYARNGSRGVPQPFKAWLSFNVIIVKPTVVSVVNKNKLPSEQKQNSILVFEQKTRSLESESYDNNIIFVYQQTQAVLLENSARLHSRVAETIQKHSCYYFLDKQSIKGGNNLTLIARAGAMNGKRSQLKVVLSSANKNNIYQRMKMESPIT